MTRKLLPFEHELIAALDITKDEYLEFVALYEKTDFGELPTADFGLTAIILTVVGIIFQVAAALLAPRPSLPELSISAREGAGQTQTRDERFSPRFGFNNAQELALYGDPINLVYANRGTGAGENPTGGVRVASSLLWSAVRSYGSSQFIQMLLMLSGGALSAIDIEKSAFGQTPVRDLITENLWMYFRAGSTGILTRNDELFNRETSDPTSYGALTENPYRIQPGIDNIRVDGFSQAYSPTTSNSVGVYGAVPIYVNVYLRDSVGDKQATNLGIAANGIRWAEVGLVPGVTAESATTIPKGSTLYVYFANTIFNGADSDVVREAKDARRSLISTFDSAALFKLGTARFKVISVSAGSIDEADVVIRLECTEAGNAPTANYLAYDPSSVRSTLTAAERTEYNRLYPGVIALLNADENPSITTPSQLVDAGVIQKGVYIQQKSYGNKDEAYIITSTNNPRSGHTYSYTLRPGWYTESYTIKDRTEYRYYRYVSVLSGYAAARKLTADETNRLRRYIQLDSAFNALGRQDDIFYTKALVRVAIAQYETVSACHIVDFALRATVYKRINGRQQEYGSGRRPGYPVSDNGLKTRVSFFKLRYKQTGQATFTTVPAIFAVSRAADNDNFVYFKFNSNLSATAAATHWAFELEPISDPIAEKAVNSTYIYLENNGSAVSTPLTSYRLSDGSSTAPSIEFVGRVLASAPGGFPPINNNPTSLNEWDLFNYDADTQIQFSFDSGPEFAVTAVTEQLRQSFADYTANNRELYHNLSLFGFNAYSGKTIQDLRSFSVFATKGRSVRRIRPDGTYPSTPDGPSSLAPDIFLDTVLDTEDGIGKYAVVNGIDLQQLARTRQFCIRNKLFMDCIIASPRSWREFWVEVAPYSLLEFARIGGRETLVPAVPYNPTTGEITRTVNVNAIFNQGNIIEGSYKEEYLDYGSNVQDLIATVVYTEVPDSAVFAKKRSIDVQRSDTLEIDAIRQTFDVSNFVSSQDQAVLIGKLLCNTRRYIRQAVEFKTFPTTDPLSPGAFIYVDIGQNSWDAIRTGIIAADGALNTPLGSTPPNGTYNFRLYRSDRGLVSLNGVNVSGGVAPSLANYQGYLFVLGNEVTTRRVFRVSEVQMDEEGETTVRATHYPCTPDGLSLLSDFSSNLFTVRS
jgi:hypothetical protein